MIEIKLSSQAKDALQHIVTAEKAKYPRLVFQGLG